MRPLTDRQRSVLSAVIESMRRDGRPPTLAELVRPGSRAGNKSGPAATLASLERRGLIARDYRQARALYVPGLNLELAEDEAGEGLRRALGLPPPEGGFDSPEEWDDLCDAMRQNVRQALVINQAPGLGP